MCGTGFITIFLLGSITVSMFGNIGYLNYSSDSRNYAKLTSLNLTNDVNSIKT